MPYVDSLTLSRGSHPSRSSAAEISTPNSSTIVSALRGFLDQLHVHVDPRSADAASRTISATSITLMSSSLAISYVSVPVSPRSNCSNSRSALQTDVRPRHVFHVDEVARLRPGLVDGQRLARERAIHEEVDHGRLPHLRPVDDVLAVQVRLQEEVRRERAVRERLDRPLADPLVRPYQLSGSRAWSAVIGNDCGSPSTAMLNGNARARRPSSYRTTPRCSSR